MEAGISCKFHCKRIAEHWLAATRSERPQLKGHRYAEAAQKDPARTREWTRIRARAELVESGPWPGLRLMAEVLG